MAARKPIDPRCTDSVDCPVPEHVQVARFKSGVTRITHITLTKGQRKTLDENRRRARNWEKRRTFGEHYGMHWPGTVR